MCGEKRTRTCETPSVPGGLGEDMRMGCHIGGQSLTRVYAVILCHSKQVSLPNERRMAEERWGVRFTHSTPRRESRSHGEGVNNVV